MAPAWQMSRCVVALSLLMLVASGCTCLQRGPAWPSPNDGPAWGPTSVSTVIDFERPHGDQGVAESQYQCEGIRFNRPAIVDYARSPGLGEFAHSGSRAIEACHGSEVCSQPVEMSFASPQRRVRVWIGYREPLAEPQIVVLRGLDRVGNEVATARTELPSSPAPQPIRWPLELRSSAAEISKAEVDFEVSHPLPGGLAVDDIEFGGGPTAGVSLDVSSTAVCSLSVSHRVGLTWTKSDGSASAEVVVQVASPEGGLQRFAVVSESGQMDAIPIAARGGGDLVARVTVATMEPGLTVTAPGRTALVPCHSVVEGKSTRIGVLLPLSGQQSEESRCLLAGVRSLAGLTGGAEVVAADTTGWDQQLRRGGLARDELQDFDALVIHTAAPAWGESRHPYLQSARSRGVPIVTLGRPVDDTAAHIDLEEGDCQQAGEQALAMALDVLTPDLFVPSWDQTPEVIPPPGECRAMVADDPETVSVLRPEVTVEPSVLQLPMRRIDVRGRFHTNLLHVRLDGPISYDTPPLGRVTVRGEDSTFFVLRDSVPPGDYQLTIIGAYGCTARRTFPLKVLPRVADPQWFVASVNWIDYLDNQESDESDPAEARLVAGGATRSPASPNRRAVVYPAGFWSAALDQGSWLASGYDLPSQYTLDLPIFWDLHSPRCLGKAIDLAVSGIERDPGSSLEGWQKLGIEALAFAIGCKTGGISGCTEGLEIGQIVSSELERKLKGGSEPLGDASLQCSREQDYCLLGERQRLRDAEMRSDNRTSAPMANIQFRLRSVAAPRLSGLKVDLTHLELTADAEGPAKPGPSLTRPIAPGENGEEIFVVSRVAPLTLATGEELNISRRFPDLSTRSWKLCTAEERAKPRWCDCNITSERCTALLDDRGQPVRDRRGQPVFKYPSRLDTPTLPLRLFSSGATSGDVPVTDVNGVPAVYLEIAVWEDDGDSAPDLVGIHSRLFWLADVLGDKDQAVVDVPPFEIRSLVDFGRHGEAGNLHAVGRALIGYRLEVTRQLAPPEVAIDELCERRGGP